MNYIKQKAKQLIKNTFDLVFKYSTEYQTLKTKVEFWDKRYLPLKELGNWYIGNQINSWISEKANINSPYNIFDSSIDDYTYIAESSKLSKVRIGKFCSIGPFLFAGWGIHPIDGISTSPTFYSTLKQNGMTLSNADKIEERKEIIIGNDVFIGSRVTILDGVEIGDGAVIGAGTIVSKNIPPYAIVYGSPLQVARYRFDDTTIERLKKSQWWNFDIKKLKLVEEYFYDVNRFLEIVENNLF